MENPRNIKTHIPKSTYIVPTFQVTNEGIIDGDSFELQFCKGNKEDETIPRQMGFFTESLLEVCAQYLRENNVGELSNREGAVAITKIEEAIMWLNKRKEDRTIRGVLGTYQK